MLLGLVYWWSDWSAGADAVGDEEESYSGCYDGSLVVPGAKFDDVSEYAVWGDWYWVVSSAEDAADYS